MTPSYSFVKKDTGVIDAARCLDTPLTASRYFANDAVRSRESDAGAQYLKTPHATALTSQAPGKCSELHKEMPVLTEPPSPRECANEAGQDLLSSEGLTDARDSSRRPPSPGPCDSSRPAPLTFLGHSSVRDCDSGLLDATEKLLLDLSLDGASNSLRPPQHLLYQERQFPWNASTSYVPRLQVAPMLGFTDAHFRSAPSKLKPKAKHWRGL
eukprot:GHVT01002870.1.p2 GENE.GHVT01002870.1~~GHVT01002870.1.p2  ORF type:complete len:212 (+),score=24.16 GHVT01002870.1:284-919(+)